MTQHQETVKTGADILAAGTALGTIVGLLPAIAALFTIIWTGLRIYETETVQRWLGKK